MPTFPQQRPFMEQGTSSPFSGGFAFTGFGGQKAVPDTQTPPMPPSPDTVFFGKDNGFVNLPAFRKQKLKERLFAPDSNPYDDLMFGVSTSNPFEPDISIDEGESYTPPEVFKPFVDPFKRKAPSQAPLSYPGSKSNTLPGLNPRSFSATNEYSLKP